MANNLSILQQRETAQRGVIKKLEAAHKKRLKAATDVLHDIQEQIRKAQGQILEAMGLGNLTDAQLKAVLKQAAAAVEGLDRGRVTRAELEEAGQEGETVETEVLETDEAPQEPVSSGRGIKMPWEGR